jgi:HK97 gp10 family phage protein
MIRKKIKYNFQGQKFIQNLERSLESAAIQGALMVERDAKKLLNNTGKSFPAKAGYNSPIFKGDGVPERKTKPADMGVSLKTLKAQRVYWYGEPLHRWVQASMPGSPPNKQTGTLQRSIIHEYSKAKKEAKIGPAQQLKYARVQELGSAQMPERPYLTPAFKMNEKKIFKLFADAVKRTMP